MYPILTDYRFWQTALFFPHVISYNALSGEKMRLRRMASALLALTLLPCSKSSSTPPVEKVENIQNFNATNSENGSTVAGTHQYSTKKIDLW
jgi:hypothetical protein